MLLKRVGNGFATKKVKSKEKNRSEFLYRLYRLNKTSTDPKVRINQLPFENVNTEKINKKIVIGKLNQRGNKSL